MELDERQILAYIGSELSQSVGGSENDSVESNRQSAYSAYLGQPDGKEVEGRSKIVSTDVADAIEWIMPEIVKAFTQNNDVVSFDPTGPNDDEQAELESRYVYDILMKENDGFIIIHQFIKDALLQKNGFLKVFYDKSESYSTESYTGIGDIERNIILSDPSSDLIEESMYDTYTEQGPIVTYDIKIRRREDTSKISVVPIPPEEFRISRNHNSVCLKKARFTAHVYLKTVSELIEEGYDKDVIGSIPGYNETDSDRDYRFTTMGETVAPNSESDYNHNKLIEIAECYTYLDIDGDGIAEMVKVEVAGGNNPDVLLSIEEIDENPFITATAILMSHKVFGLSIYDRLKQIQEQKTTLWRNIFDNMYLQNNQRTIVVENQVNIDDLMMSRPGGVIRAKRLDAIAPYQTPALSSDAYKMMDYLDQVRAGRSGVTPEGPVTDSMIGDRVGSEGIEKMLSQKEELVGLMIRVIAETGIKPLCYMIRSQAIRHQDAVKNYKFRGEWVQVNPSSWKSRTGTTVRVGTGSGNRKQESVAIGSFMGLQERLLVMPGQTLVRPNEVFKAADDFAKANGLPGASGYFLDPVSPEGQQHKQLTDQSVQQQKQMEQQIEAANMKVAQAIAQAETTKANAAAQTVQLKGQIESAKNQLEQYKARSTSEVEMLKQDLAEANAIINKAIKDGDLEFKYWDAGNRHSIEKERVEVQRLAVTTKKEESNGDE